MVQLAKQWIYNIFFISRNYTWGIFTNILEYSNICDILPQEFLNVGVMAMYNVAKICMICAKLSRLDGKTLKSCVIPRKKL